MTFVSFESGFSNREDYDGKLPRLSAHISSQAGWPSSRRLVVGIESGAADFATRRGKIHFVRFDSRRMGSIDFSFFIHPSPVLNLIVAIVFHWFEFLQKFSKLCVGCSAPSKAERFSYQSGRQCWRHLVLRAESSV